MSINLKGKAIQNAAIVIAGRGGEQVIRLSGNLILTRLLVPEYFGLMAITSVAMLALALFSDVGSGAGVIRSPRGLEPNFLNTAWTLQILRGAGLWALMILLAYPAAQFYGQPILVSIFPVTGFSLFLNGCNSMSLVKKQKNLELAHVIILNITSQFIGLVCMVLLAFVCRNIWALVLGGLVAPAIKLYWSYRLDRSIKHRFMLDKTAGVELFHFGKWIFLSTAMMFLSTQADRILLGKLFSISLFGIYNIAAVLAEAPKNLVLSISTSVIFPLIAMHSELSDQELRTKILQKRKTLLAALAFFVALFSGFGDVLVVLLYDDRYREAGWMLPILALGMWPLILYASLDRCLFVRDNPKYPALGKVLKFTYLVTCLPIAYHLAEKLGVILAVAFSEILPYLIVNFELHRKKFSGLRQDAWATLLLFALLFIIIIFRHYMGLGIPGISIFSESY